MIDDIALAIQNAYRWILGREADQAGLEHHAHRISSGEISLADLRVELLSCEERQGNGARLNRAIYACENPVDTECSEETRAEMLSRIQRSWQILGEQSAHWSVITGQEFIPENIDRNLATFYHSGEVQAHMIDCTLRRNGVDPAALRSAMDYGCGVGRITLGLAKRYASVVGVDVSEPHLHLARERASSQGVTNATFIKLQSIGDVGALEPVDLVVSFIVLQHNPPPVALAILTALLGRLRSGGVAIFQIPTFMEGYSFSAIQYLARSQPLMEIHTVPQPAIFAAIQEADCRVLEVREDLSLADLPAISQMFVVRKV